MMSAKFAGNFFVSLLGTWEVSASIVLKVSSNVLIILLIETLNLRDVAKEAESVATLHKYDSSTYCFFVTYNSSFNKIWSTVCVCLPLCSTFPIAVREVNQNRSPAIAPACAVSY